MMRAIASTGTMTRAAQTLYVSQSALSQQLKDIEGKLGAALFFRSRRRMILTALGKRLLATADLVIDTVDEAERAVAQTVSGEQGELKVGTQCVFCYKWLPAVVQKFQESFPNVTLEIGTCRELAEDLETNAFDLVITGTSAVDERSAAIPLFHDQIVCIMNESHPLTAKERLQPDDFGRFNLVSHNRKEVNWFYRTVLKPHGVDPRRYMLVGEPQAIVDLVASGIGLAVFPRWAVRTALGTATVVARPITNGGLPMTWCVATLPNGQLPTFQQAFVDMVRQMDVPHLHADGCHCGIE